MTDEVKTLMALLFVRGELISWQSARNELGMSNDALHKVVEVLREELADSALTVMAGEEGMELVTAPEVSELVARWEEEIPEELSKAAAETLAIVGYRGPLARQEITAIRGVESRQMLRQLERRHLVQRLPSDNGVVLFDLTLESFKQLGISDRSQLPDYENLSSDERLQAFLHDIKR